MKINIILNALGGGGAERVVQTLANHLANDHRIRLFYLEKLAPVYPLDPSIESTTLRSGLLNRGPGKFLSLPVQATELVQLLNRFPADANLSLLFRANLVHLLTRNLGNRAPILISDRNPPTEQYALSSLQDRTMRYLIRRFYPHADHDIAISEGVARSTESFGLPRERISVIHNPQDCRNIIELARESPAVDLSPWPRPRIVTSGRLTYQKDYPTLIRSFHRVIQDTPASLIILGQGEEEANLRALVRELGLDSRIAFLGWQSNPFAIFNQCDLFLLTSRFEGFGNVILEAMLCGLPTVVTNSKGGPNEILDNGRWGRLVPVGDVDAIAAVVSSLLQNSNSRKALQKAGIERAWQFDVAIVARRYLEVFEKYGKDSPFCS